MTTSSLFKTCFFDRSFVAAPQITWPSFAQQSASTQDHVVWFVQHTPTLQLRYRVLGPPTMLAACAWLAHHVSDTTGPWSWDALQQQCMAELDIPYTQHPLVAFVLAPLQHVLASQ